ncbi:DUF4097 family beta strand repeat-containing protein [Puia sp. P3]|uniref:DUF4097 family beta strand repeat-containing protein n=1 Tax=Puia sp. P3 TaxID=3423952 RepID=UPI003D666EA9
MKRIRIVFLTGVILLVAGSNRLMAQSKEQQLVVPLSEPGKPFKVNVHVLYGSIKVAPYEGKEVVIDVFGDSSRKHRDDEAAPGGMHRIGGGSGLNVTAEERNNNVEVNGGLSKLSGIMVKVPAGLTSLQLGAVNDGSITVNGVSGAVEINNVNGPVTVKDAVGSVVANTVNGAVIVNFKSVDTRAPMAFSTLNGNVDVTFPADMKTNLKLKTDRGGVFTDYEVAVDKSQPATKKTEENHMYKLSIDEWMYGKINGGGPEVMMKTMNGDIYIRKAK